MVDLYSNENFPFPTVGELQQLGYDVLTCQAAGQANQGISDPAVLQYATSINRAVITLSSKDFIRLHKSSQQHAGIIVCKENLDFKSLALSIDKELKQHNTLIGQLVKIP